MILHDAVSEVLSEGATKRLSNSAGLVEQGFGLSLAYRRLPDRQASLEHECGKPLT